MLIQRDGENVWREPATHGFADERALQDLLETSPEILPGASGSALLVVDELQVPVGAIDLVALALDGSIFLIECKLRANPEIRRHVVGQILAYAASLQAMPFEAFRRAVDSRRGGDLVTAMQNLAGETEFDGAAFLDAVRTNQQAGRFHLVVTVDEITDELKATVSYLNTHTNRVLSVLALELRRLRDADVSILLPAVYGEEAVRRKETAQHAWDETAFLGALHEFVTPEIEERLLEVFAHARDHASSTQMYWGNGRFWWGQGRYPSAGAWFHVGGSTRGASVWSIYTDPQKTVFAFNFEWVQNAGVPAATLGEVVRRVSALPGVASLYSDVAARSYKVRTSLPVATVFRDPAAPATVIQCVDLIIGSGAETDAQQVTDGA